MSNDCQHGSVGAIVFYLSILFDRALLPSASPQPQQKLSSSLKARLKRTRRSFTSPFSVAKRLCVDEEDGQHVPTHSRIADDDDKNPPLISLSVDADYQEARPGSEKFSRRIPGPARSHLEDLAQRRERLSEEVKVKTETLRRLRMVKMYRSKVGHSMRWEEGVIIFNFFFCFNLWPSFPEQPGTASNLDRQVAELRSERVA